MGRCAMAVLTRNHASVIAEVLQHNLKLYESYGIDVYYLDSSEGDDTENLIKEYKNAGFDNLYYIRCDKASSLDYKLGIAFSQSKFERKYDYIWPLKDRSFYDEVVFEKLKDSITRNPDAIFFDFLSGGVGSKRDYEECTTFFYDCAYLTPNLETVVYNANTVLNNYRLESEKEIKEGHKLWFSMTSELFNGLARLPKCHVEAWNLEGMVQNANYPGSTYKGSVFYVWKDCWLDVMDNCIDSIYDQYKGKVIKQATMLPYIFGHRVRINEYKKSGELREDNLENVLHQWERVSDIPGEFLTRVVFSDYNPENDLELIKNFLSEDVQVLLELYNAVCNGIVNKTNFPFEDFKTIVMNFFLNKYSSYGEIFYVKKGITERVLNKMLTAEDGDFRTLAENSLFIMISEMV